MKVGKEPMRTFGDLMQFFETKQAEPPTDHPPQPLAASQPPPEPPAASQPAPEPLAASQPTPEPALPQPQAGEEPPEGQS
jgi:hypothetical protein